MDESVVRNLLLTERTAALHRLHSMKADFEAIVADAMTSNADDEHDPEGSTIAYERARVAALIAWAQSDLDELEHAMAKLSDGSYSWCEACHRQISEARLAARPAVRTCIDCASSPRPRW